MVFQDSTENHYETTWAVKHAVRDSSVSRYLPKIFLYEGPEFKSHCIRVLLLITTS